MSKETHLREERLVQDHKSVRAKADTPPWVSDHLFSTLAASSPVQGSGQGCSLG